MKNVFRNERFGGEGINVHVIRTAVVDLIKLCLFLVTFSTSPAFRQDYRYATEHNFYQIEVP
jgi:hypothetical protein